MRWLLVAALLLALLAVLATGQRSGRLRSSRLNRKAHLVAGQVKRNQIKLRRRGEAINNEVAPIAKASSRAKGRLRKKGYRTKKKEDTPKRQGKAGGSRRADRPGRGKKRRYGAARRRMASAKDVCLLKALQRCGKRITRVRSTSSFGRRCQAKEKFLDCMSQSQQRGCKARKRRRRRGVLRRLIRQRQRRLQKLLINSRGCVIGVDLSAATPLINR